jgi:hypothetical protein
VVKITWKRDEQSLGAGGKTFEVALPAPGLKLFGAVWRDDDDPTRYGCYVSLALEGDAGPADVGSVTLLDHDSTTYGKQGAAQWACEDFCEKWLLQTSAALQRLAD